MKVRTAGSPDVPAARPRVVLAVLWLGSMSAALMQTLVIPIQGRLPELLETSAGNASWAVTATLLGAAVAMPVAGRLADISGKKPVLVWSAAILLAGSLVCAVSESLAPLLVGRILQGLAMGYLPVAISLVTEVIPPRLVNAAVAGVSATMGVGAALGLPLAAYIAQEFDWHALFWLSAALAAAMTVLSAGCIPHVHDKHPARFDALGAVGLAAGLVTFLVGVSKGTEWGWREPRTIGVIATGLVLLLLWAAFEVRHPQPLVDLRTTARRPVLLTNLAAVLIGFAMMAQLIVVPQLLQLPEAVGFGMGLSILEAGLWMAPSGLMMLVFAPVSSRLLTSFGGRVTLALGAAVMACGYAVAVFLTSAPWQMTITTCVIAAGVGIGYAAMPSLILEHVPEAEAGSSVGVNALMRSIGTTLAGAVMAAVLASDTLRPAAGMPELPTPGAFRWCLLIGAWTAVLGAVTVLMIARRPRADGAGRPVLVP